MLDVLLILVVAGLFIYALKRAGVGSASAAENREEAEAFLRENATKDGVQVTDSGMQFLLLNESQGDDAQARQTPGASDEVTVHYEGKLLDGTVFDSSIKRGEPISFALNQVISGWTEGLQLMAKGEKARLFIPSELGYGNRRVGNIPGGSLLIFDVELIAVNGQ